MSVGKGTKSNKEAQYYKFMNNLIEYIESEWYLDLLNHLVPIIYFILALCAILVIYVWIKLEKTTDFTIINKTSYKYKENHDEPRTPEKNSKNH